jgi:OOP family OmpA-OmpF porin
MKWSNLTLFSKALIAITIAAVIGVLVYFLSPGLKVDKSKSLDKLELSDKDVNNVITSEEMSLPAEGASTEISSKPLVRIGGYAWNAHYCSQWRT